MMEHIHRTGAVLPKENTVSKRGLTAVGCVAALLVAAALMTVFTAPSVDGDGAEHVNFSVYYDGNNGSINLTSVAKGQDLTCMIIPEKGYCVPDMIVITVNGMPLKDFSYETPSGALKISSERIGGDIKISGDCFPKSFRITLVPYASSGAASFTATYGSGKLVGYTSPSLDASTFKGYWSHQKGAGTQVIDEDGILVADAAGYSSGGVWIGERACALYAKWEQIGPGVIYHGNGGHFRGGADVMKGDCHLRFDKTPKYDYYRFLGWAEESNAKVPKYMQGATVRLAEGTELYAVWEFDGTAPTDSRGSMYIDVFLPLMVLAFVAAAVIAVVRRRDYTEEI